MRCSIGGRLGSVHVSAVVDEAAVDVGEQTSQGPARGPSGCARGGGLAGPAG